MLMVVSMATSEGPSLFYFLTITTIYYYIKYSIILALLTTAISLHFVWALAFLLQFELC